MRWLLVALQFTSAALLVLSTDFDFERAIVAGVLCVPGAVLAIWAWFAMGLTRVRIAPDVAEDARLVTAPPYRWIRHPMYSGLLLFSLAFLAADFLWWRVVVFAVLAFTLEAKASLEERLLALRFSDYHAYRQKSWKFFPLLY